MPTIFKFLSDYGFTALQIVKGRSSIADLYRKRRCGIYVLLFADGRAYIGQSVDVVRRFAQHLKVHRDIEVITFKPVPLRELDSAEQDAIKAAEQSGHKLRNITFSAAPPVESDFDLILSAEDQVRWLSDLHWVDADGPRVVNPDLRDKYAAKYQRLLAHSDIDNVLRGLRSYVQAGIPAIRRSEASFWAVSCLPAYPNPEITLFLRVNVNWQEVLTIYREKSSGLDLVSLHVAREPIKRDSKLKPRFRALKTWEHAYVPGGHDQIKLSIPCHDLRALMDRDSVRMAVRSFNHRLMEKGPCVFGRHHCLQLADHLVGEGDGNS